MTAAQVSLVTSVAFMLGVGSGMVGGGLIGGVLTSRFICGGGNMHQCPCGRPLHYQNKALEVEIKRIIAEVGETKPVTTSEGTWLVPLHYIALHGISAKTLPEVAKRLGFLQVGAEWRSTLKPRSLSSKK